MDMIPVYLETRLKELEKAIEETRKRLPAHSVKPPVMMELLRLEDERDELLKKREYLRDSRENRSGG
jgi:hypothetical protein